MCSSVHNDFHVEHGIFPLFEGLQVANMEKPLHRTGTPTPIATNGDAASNGDSGVKDRKPKLDELVDAAKSAASAVTNGLNSLKVSN